MESRNTLSEIKDKYLVAHLWAEHEDGHIIFVQLPDIYNNVFSGYRVDFGLSIFRYYEGQGREAREVRSLSTDYSWELEWIEVKPMLWVPFAELIEAPEEGHTPDTMIEGLFMEVEEVTRMVNSGDWCVTVDHYGKRVTIANPVTTMSAGTSLLK